MKRLCIILVGVMFFVASCEKEIGSETSALSQTEGLINNRNARTSVSDIDKIYDGKSNLKREFGKALLLAMKESSKLRELIKREALKKINKDADVLYALIKDEPLENGQTVVKYYLKKPERKKSY